MLRPIVRLPRRLVVSLVFLTVAAASLTTSGTPAVAASRPTVTASGNPKVIVGTRKGPIDVRGNNAYGMVASMAIPVGAWSITAKLNLQSTPTATVTCQLTAGSDSHVMTTDLNQSPGGGGQWQSLVLMTTHRFNATGAAALRCQQSSFHTGDVLARDIRIAAMHVGNLTTVVYGGTPVSSGSGKPQVRALSRDPAVEFTGGGVFRDVATLAIPAGPWWITASATVSRSNPNGDITCRLQAPVDFDETTSTAASFRSAPMNLQVTHNYDSLGTVTLQCKSDVNPVVSNVRIVAVQAGHLVNRQIGGGEWTYGSGTPVIISGFRNDGGAFAGTPSTLGALTLPAGSWLLSAKLYLDIGGSQGMDALCKLSAAGPAIDQVNLALDKYQRAIVSLEGARSFGAGGATVRVTCQSVPDLLIIHGYWIKLTAIRASGLTQRFL